MTTETFTDHQGRKYVAKAYNKQTKNHQESGKEKDLDLNTAIMMEQPEDPQCPVKSFEEYVSQSFMQDILPICIRSYYLCSWTKDIEVTEDLVLM